MRKEFLHGGGKKRLGLKKQDTSSSKQQHSLNPSFSFYFPPDNTQKIPPISRGPGEANANTQGILPLKNLLQGFPSECVAVLEDIVEGMEGAQLPTLLLMVNMLWQ